MSDLERAKMAEEKIHSVYNFPLHFVIHNLVFQKQGRAQLLDLQYISNMNTHIIPKSQSLFLFSFTMISTWSNATEVNYLEQKRSAQQRRISKETRKLKKRKENQHLLKCCH